MFQAVTQHLPRRSVPKHACPVCVRLGFSCNTIQVSHYAINSILADESNLKKFQKFEWEQENNFYVPKYRIIDKAIYRTKYQHNGSTWSDNMIMIKYITNFFNRCDIWTHLIPQDPQECV